MGFNNGMKYFLPIFGGIEPRDEANKHYTGGGGGGRGGRVRGFDVLENVFTRLYSPGNEAAANIPTITYQSQYRLHYYCTTGRAEYSV